YSRVFLTRLHRATILDALFRSIQRERRKRFSMRIHPLDLAIVIAYLLAVTALGMRFRRGQQNATDYFLGGRTAPWWALPFSIVVALTVLYTFEGGMKAVIWTDVAQLLLYLTGSAVTFFVLLHRIPGGWSEVTQVAAAAGHKLQVLDFSWNLSAKYTFWSGLIGGAFLTMATHGTDQIIVQRLLAAKSERDSRRA